MNLLRNGIIIGVTIVFVMLLEKIEKTIRAIKIFNPLLEKYTNWKLYLLAIVIIISLSII